MYVFFRIFSRLLRVSFKNTIFFSFVSLDGSILIKRFSLEDVVMTFRKGEEERGGEREGFSVC